MHELVCKGLGEDLAMTKASILCLSMVAADQLGSRHCQRKQKMIHLCEQKLLFYWKLLTTNEALIVQFTSVHIMRKATVHSY